MVDGRHFENKTLSQYLSYAQRDGKGTDKRVKNSKYKMKKNLTVYKGV